MVIGSAGREEVLWKTGKVPFRGGMEKKGPQDAVQEPVWRLCDEGKGKEGG